MRQQLEIVQTCLEELVGYRGERGIVVPDYQFVVGDGTVVSADHIAFADPHRQDISSACIAVKWWPNGENKSQFLEQVSYLGTPLTLFVNQYEVEWWLVQAVITTFDQPQCQS